MLNWQQDHSAGDCTDIHTIMHCWVYRLRYTRKCQCGRPKTLRCWERFRIHGIGRIDGRRGFRTGGNVFWIGGNTFYNRKNKILIQIPEFKRSGIGIITEFRRIPNRFPNQGLIKEFIIKSCLVNQRYSAFTSNWYDQYSTYAHVIDTFASVNQLTA